MKTMKKIFTKFLVAGIFIVGSDKIAAQSTSNPSIPGFGYKTAIGLRIGETSGITVKHFLADKNAAFEGIVGFWPFAVSITGLYENYATTGIHGLSWYYGAGAHFTTAVGRNYYDVYYDKPGRFYTYHYSYGGASVGIDGIVGLEYKIPKGPFAFSFDLKPLVEMNNSGNFFMAMDPSLGAKITF